mmetsp:Transcript_36429/g.83702  ORF Transcript_36429/g.83702 Transcript_36429/m.83702 type:complete len:378 (+) Transcript_36429:42-1175(+)
MALLEAAPSLTEQGGQWASAGSQAPRGSQAPGGAMLPSIFKQNLPQTRETIEVQLPRGLKFPGSPHLAVGKMKAVDVPSKSYTMVVLPSARKPKPKEQLKKPTVGPVGVMHNECDNDESALDDRSSFRTERAQQFHAGRHFPALVSPRLAPSYSNVASGDRATSSRSTSPPLSVGAPSRSLARAPGSKTTEASSHWVLTRKEDAGELVSNRLPSLHEGAYDAFLGQQREECRDSKKRWIAGPLVPTGAHDAKRALDTSRAEVDNQISGSRLRGKAAKELLKSKYEKRRAAYQKENVARDKSSFELRFPDLPPALPVAPSCPSPPQSPRFGREKSSRLWKDEQIELQPEVPRLADPMLLGLFKSAFHVQAVADTPAWQ